MDEQPSKLFPFHLYGLANPPPHPHPFPIRKALFQGICRTQHLLRQQSHSPLRRPECSANLRRKQPQKFLQKPRFRQTLSPATDPKKHAQLPCGEIPGSHRQQPSARCALSSPEISLQTMPQNPGQDKKTGATISSPRRAHRHPRV